MTNDETSSAAVDLPGEFIRHSSFGNSSFLDTLLAEQASLNAVERFAQRHADSPPDGPLYRDLIPLSRPKSGEQYAFEVDLDACSGCKACVVACHSLNGLDEDESWRDVGMLVSQSDAAPISVTSACHHCADPACANGCPTLAYEKDQDTGIVRHLDDQCIGCSYCEMKCPYGVPKYNDTLGIVRKCDMCHGRLAEGEAPACVDACPNGAIAIKVVKVEPVAPGLNLLPGTVDSAYTQPSTLFKTERDLSSLKSADSGSAGHTHTHLPLVIMLAFTQSSVGIGAAAALSSSRTLAIFAAVIGMIGMVASVLHLGTPSKAWRAFLGLRRSWLSREIVAFGGWMPLVVLGTLLAHPLVLWPALLAGLLAVFCSAMVYIDCHRPSWRPIQTLPRFFGTVLLTGAAALIWAPLVLLVLAGAVAERAQFFRSMTVLKMPGV